MITITLPEWFAWLLVALTGLHLVTGILGLYLALLKHKLAATDAEQKP